MPLSHDLVAIIGNKGSGKSAMADIVALAGATTNFKSFSFLKATRFRNPRTKLAQHFLGALGWHAGTESDRQLDHDPPHTSVETARESVRARAPPYVEITGVAVSWTHKHQTNNTTTHTQSTT